MEISSYRDASHIPVGDDIATARGVCFRSTCTRTRVDTELDHARTLRRHLRRIPPAATKCTGSPLSLHFSAGSKGACRRIALRTERRKEMRQREIFKVKRRKEIGSRVGGIALNEEEDTRRPPEGEKETRRDAGDQGGHDEEEDRRIERGCRPAGEVVGTIAVTTLVAWYTLLVVHTHDPSLCLPRFSLSHFISVFPSLFSPSFSLSRLLLHVRAFPPGAHTYVQRSCAYTRTRIHSWTACILVCTCACSLASLFFSASSLSRCVEGNSRSLLLLSFASVGRPRKHTPRQGDLLGETSSSTQPWTRFLYASLLRSPSVRLAISLYFSRSF